MKTKKFTRTKEDFICEKCSFDVKGDGYTNHCPKCLWCKHVDINPGDRAESCGGMMDPVGVEVGGGKQILIHSCIKCGMERKNKVQKNDDFNEVLKLIGFEK